MALIWQRQNSLSTDFLGNADECYTFQGNAHEHLANKFLDELHRQHKQFLFFYGEQGMGKSRLAKQTARELARLVNADNPLLSLFLINCERYRKDNGPTYLDLQRDIAQKVAAVDEKLSKSLSQCKIHDFSSLLSSFLKDKVFLFLFDGIITNFQAVVSFMDDIVKDNTNVIIFATTSEYLGLTKQKEKISTHSCTGLSHDAAVALLQEVAGATLEPELEAYQDDLVCLCHLNPFLIMRTGQQMNDDIFPYTPKEMKGLLQSSLMLAMSGDNVPEREDIFQRELALAERFTKDMGRNIGLVLEQSKQQFTAADVAKTMNTKTSDEKAKKSLLELLAHTSVLTHDKGFYSLSVIFQDFCEEQSASLNVSRDEVVVEVYKELTKTLKCFLSEKGLQKVFMIHGDEMRQIRDLEKMISKEGFNDKAMRFINRGHFINACCSFLWNIPLDSRAVSEFKENSFAHLYRFQERSRSAPAAGGIDALNQQFKQLGVKVSKLQNGHRRETGDRVRGAREFVGDSEALKFDRRRKIVEEPCEYQNRPNEGKCGRVDVASYCQKGIDGNQRKPVLAAHIGDARRVEPCKYQRTPNDNRHQGSSDTRRRSRDDSMRDRFGLEKSSPFSHFSDISSLKSSDDSEPDEESLATQTRGVGNMPTRLDFGPMYPEPPPHSNYRPPPSENIPVECSDHLEQSPPQWYTTGPSQQSFHEWPDGTPHGEWSMENNPPSPSHWRHVPPE